MLSTKLTNQMLLGSLAFGVSFTLGLLVHRALIKALMTGAVTLPACYIAGAIVTQRRMIQATQTRNSLYLQIQDLEYRENSLYQCIYSAATLQQELEASIQALQLERIQLLHRVSGLHQQRNDVYQQVCWLKQQQQQQIEAADRQRIQLDHLRSKSLELDRSISVQSLQLQPVESKLALLRRQVEELQSSVLERQELQREISATLSILEDRRIIMRSEIQGLQEQMETLQESKKDLQAITIELKNQKQAIEIDIARQQEKLTRLQTKLNVPAQLLEQHSELVISEGKTPRNSHRSSL